jgi:hypothetical protein
MASIFPEADIVTMPNSYGETAELIDGHAKHLRRIELGRSLAEITSFRGSRPRILLLDSCTSVGAFEAIVKCAQPLLDLVVFDTTCFSSGSGHIVRALNWAHDTKIPIVLLRSHTKLDSLGVEYGRLGSVVFTSGPHAKDLLTETRNAVRLFGGAALPAHFPPFVGAPAYRSLTNRRVAAILRNNRRACAIFPRRLPVHLPNFTSLMVYTSLDFRKDARRERSAGSCRGAVCGYGPQRLAAASRGKLRVRFWRGRVVERQDQGSLRGQDRGR